MAIPAGGAPSYAPVLTPPVAATRGIPAGGVPQYPPGALDDFVVVKRPDTTATATMTRGAWVSYWGPEEGFTLVRAVGVVVPPWLST